MAPVIFPEQLNDPVVPSTVQPVSVLPPDMATVPFVPVGPMLIVPVAPPPKLIVVAVVLSKLNDELPVVNDVATLGEVISGVLLNTATPPLPLPVSSFNDAAKTEESALVVILLLASKNKALLAVKAARLMVESLSTVLPVPLASKVRSPFAPVAIVNAPESAMLLVVNV